MPDAQEGAGGRRHSPLAHVLQGELIGARARFVIAGTHAATCWPVRAQDTTALRAIR